MDNTIGIPAGASYLRFFDDSDRTADVVFVDLRYYIPESNEYLVPWNIVNGDRDPQNYLRSGEYDPIPEPELPVSAPQPKLFIDSLKTKPDLPIEFIPYLNAWTLADIVNDNARKAFWAKVKNSKAYFLTPEIIQAVESLALSCNLPLE